MAVTIRASPFSCSSSSSISWIWNCSPRYLRPLSPPALERPWCPGMHACCTRLVLFLSSPLLNKNMYKSRARKKTTTRDCADLTDVRIATRDECTSTIFSNFSLGTNSTIEGTRKRARCMTPHTGRLINDCTLRLVVGIAKV